MKAWTKTDGDTTTVGCPRCLKAQRRGGHAKFSKNQSGGILAWLKKHGHHDG